MTTKQAADIIRMLLGYLKGEIEPPKQETIEEAKAFEQQGYECLEMAIKALEQQPCEDCISREAVNDGFKKYENGSFAYGCVRGYINELPSVTPKEKVGHWIIAKDKYGDIYEAVCSCCDKNGVHKYTYCPWCGARMVSE